LSTATARAVAVNPSLNRQMVELPLEFVDSPTTVPLKVE
jgi:hypothetical protein